MRRVPTAFILCAGLILAAAAPVAAARLLCHTDAAAQACECCAHPQPSSDKCHMGCTGARQTPPAEARWATPRCGERAAAVLQPSTSLHASMADAAAFRPICRARAPEASSEALYLLDRTFRL